MPCFQKAGIRDNQSEKQGYNKSSYKSNRMSLGVFVPTDLGNQCSVYVVGMLQDGRALWAVYNKSHQSFIITLP